MLENNSMDDFQPVIETYIAPQDLDRLIGQRFWFLGCDADTYLCVGMYARWLVLLCSDGSIEFETLIGLEGNYTLVSPSYKINV